MANPYDFTSGYLGARQQLSQEQQARDLAVFRADTLKESKAERVQKYGLLAPMYGAQTDYYRANAGGLRIKNRADQYKQDRLEYLNKNLVDPQLNSVTQSLGLKTEPIDYSILNRDWRLGFRPTLTGEHVSLEEDADGTPGGVRVRRFREGTQGGLNLTPLITNDPRSQSTMQQPVEAVIAGDSAMPAPPAPAAPSVAASPEKAPSDDSGLSALDKRNPKMADAVAKNVFGMTDNQFRKLSGALALADFGMGKITSADLTNQVEGLRKMQSEGVLRAVEQVLSGNEKKAIELYHQNGEDSDSVLSMKKIQIANPIASAMGKKGANATKDSYEGVFVTMKDGSTLTLDPRRLATDIIGIGKSMEHDEKVASSLRQQESSKHHTDAINSQTRETREGRLQLQRDALDRQLQGMVATDLENETKRRLKLYMDDSSIDQKLKTPDQIDKQYSGIMSSLRPVAEIASLNISGGLNKNASFNSVFEAIRKSDFVDNGQGGPITKQVNGLDMMLTSNGVWLPRNGSPMRADPAAFSGPAPSQVSAPPPAPAPAPAPVNQTQVDNSRYTRTKTNRGTYQYTVNQRSGKTKAEWAASDAQ